MQSSEPGVIRARYVNEGDVVEKGQLLFDIDPVDAKTMLDQAQKRYASLMIKSIRLEAEVNNSTPSFSRYYGCCTEWVSTELALFQAN